MWGRVPVGASVCLAGRGVAASGGAFSAGGEAAREEARAPGGGADGTGIGREASLVARPTARGAFVALTDFFESLTARRLIGPRTGTRGTNTQPTLGTGFPPTRRPSSNNQSYWPWNSWYESLEMTVALTLLAMVSTKASPRPMAPAGGATSSLFSIAASNSDTSRGSIRCPNVASTTTVTTSSGCSSM